MNYECKKCFHQTKQKIEMKRHLDRLTKCITSNVDALKYSDEELYNMSLTKLKLEKKHICENIDNKVINKVINNDEFKFICYKCNLKFHNKSNLNRHINTKKCNEQYVNITNNNTVNQQNNIININLNILRSFEDDWDISKIDEKLRKTLLESHMKYTNTLEKILDNDVNLNVIINQNENAGIVYTDGPQRFKPMSIDDIVDKSMDKLHRQLNYFYNDIKNQTNNYYSIDENILNEIKNTTNKKYEDFKLNKNINSKVKDCITNIYNNKKNETLKIYETLLINDDEKELLEGY